MLEDKLVHLKLILLRFLNSGDYGNRNEIWAFVGKAGGGFGCQESIPKTPVQTEYFQVVFQSQTQGSQRLQVESLQAVCRTGRHLGPAFAQLTAVNADRKK
ncbi:hypothetical protein KCU70_g214, partial [Aureobasidium melanogenum]